MSTEYIAQSGGVDINNLPGSSALPYTNMSSAHAPDTLDLIVEKCFNYMIFEKLTDDSKLVTSRNHCKNLNVVTDVL